MGELFEKPQDEWEAIAKGAIEKRESNRLRGQNTEMFKKDGRPTFTAEKSKVDKSVIDPPSNTPEDIGNYSNVPPKNSLVTGGAEVKSSTGQGRETEMAPLAVEDLSGWDQYEVISEPWAQMGISDPGNVVGLFRAAGSMDYPVTRAWTAQGQPFAVYDGRSLQRPDDLSVKTPDEGFLLADEPAAAWLRGELPKSKIPLTPDIAYHAMGLKHFPYSGVTNVLITLEIKGLMVGVKWAAQLEQLKRFGGMPVIAVPKGGEEVLQNIFWDEEHPVTIRASDKTWEVIEMHVPLEVKRKGLR